MGSACSGHVDVLTTLDTDTLERLQAEFDEVFSVPLKRRASGRAAGNKGTEGWLCSRGSGTRGSVPGKRGSGTH